MVGDVAGKGVLASQELSRENAEQLSVTLLFGILDLESGELSLLNAGHDGSWRGSADGCVEQITCPTDVGGPPLCVIDDFAYVAQKLSLSPGDTLCLISDGVSEAMNVQHEQYGAKRLESGLKATAGKSRRPMR